MALLVMAINAYSAYDFVRDLKPRYRLLAACYATCYTLVCFRLVATDVAALARYASECFSSFNRAYDQRSGMNRDPASGANSLSVSLLEARAAEPRASSAAE